MYLYSWYFFLYLQVDIGGDSLELMFFPTEQDLMYTHFSQMSIASDIQQKLSIQAVNKVFLRSDKVRKDLLVYLDTPQVDGKFNIYKYIEASVAEWSK